METKLNENEVKEVARMQRLITKYENVITALYLKAKTGKEVKLLLTEESDLQKEINYLWQWVREYKDNK